MMHLSESSAFLRQVAVFLVGVAFLGRTTTGRQIICETNGTGNLASDSSIGDPQVDWDSVPSIGVGNHYSICSNEEGQERLGCSIGGTVISVLEADELVTGEQRELLAINNDYVFPSERHE